MVRRRFPALRAAALPPPAAARVDPCAGLQVAAAPAAGSFGSSSPCLVPASSSGSFTRPPAAPRPRLLRLTFFGSLLLLLLLLLLVPVPAAADAATTPDPASSSPSPQTSSSWVTSVTAESSATTSSTAATNQSSTLPPTSASAGPTTPSPSSKPSPLGKIGVVPIVVAVLLTFCGIGVCFFYQQQERANPKYLLRLQHEAEVFTDEGRLAREQFLQARRQQAAGLEVEHIEDGGLGPEPSYQRRTRRDNDSSPRYSRGSAAAGAYAAPGGGARHVQQRASSSTRLLRPSTEQDVLVNP